MSQKTNASSLGSAAPPRKSAAMPTSDRETLRRLQARDERTFVELIERYHGSLLRLALVFVSSRAVAEEVVQETWVGVLNGLATFEGRSSLKTWIFRILTNRAKTRGVRENRMVPFSGMSEQEEQSEPAVDPGRFQSNGMWGSPPTRWEDGTPDRLLMNRQAIHQLEAALGALPPNQRAVVTLRDIDGLDSDEVCNILEISETNQRVLLHRARSKLRAVLEPYVERT